MAYQVTEIRGTSLHIKAVRQPSGRERVPKASKRARQLLLPVRSPTRRPSYTTNICAEGLGLTHRGSLVVGSISVSPGELTLGGFLCLLPLCLLQSFPSSTGFPEFCLMFGCGLLYCYHRLMGEASLGCPGAACIRGLLRCLTVFVSSCLTVDS